MAETDPTMQVRLDVAEIKGMLTQAISNQEARLTSLETRTNNHDVRIGNNDTRIGRHDERLHDLENDVKEAKDDSKSQQAMKIATGSLLVAGIVGLIAVFNFVTGLPV